MAEWKGDLSKPIRDIAEEFTQTDDGIIKLSKFVNLTKDPGFIVFQEILLRLQGFMATDLLSSRVTKLDTNNKDIVQRTYYNLNLIINFLLNPTKPIVTKLDLIKHNLALERQAKSSSKPDRVRGKPNGRTK